MADAATLCDARHMLRMVVCVIVLGAACGRSANPATKPTPVASAAEETSATVDVDDADERAPSTPAPAARVEPTPDDLHTPAAADPAIDAIHQELLVFLQQVGAAVDRAGGDCGKAAAGIDDVLDANAAWIAKVKTYKDDPEVQQQTQRWMQDHMNEIMAPAMKLAEIGQRCAGDERFVETMTRIQDL